MDTIVFGSLTLFTTFSLGALIGHALGYKEAKSEAKRKHAYDYERGIVEGRIQGYNRAVKMHAIKPLSVVK